MKKYWAIAKAELIDASLNKAEIFLWILKETIPTMILVFLWMSNPIIGSKSNYSSSMLIMYYLLTFFISRFTGFYFENHLQGLIRDGELSRHLVKPIKPFRYLIAQNLGGKIFHFLFIALPIVFILMMFFSEHLTFPSVISLVTFLTFLILAYFIRFFLCLMFSSTAFFTEQAQGMIHLHWMLDVIAGGSALPLNFYPSWALKIVNLLPFRFVYSVPINAYLNQPMNFVQEFAVGMAWLVILYLTCIFIWKIGLKKYTSVGN